MYRKQCYKNCPQQKFYAKKLDIHFDWLDCIYECKYGNDKLKDYRASGCRTIAEWEETEGYKKKWENV